MEEDRSSDRKKRKREKLSPPLPRPLDLSSFDQTAFPQILAAVSNTQNPHARSLIKRFLHSLLSLFTPTTSLLLPRGFLSLFPLLLTTSCPSVAALSLEVIGMAALCSLEANAMIASDESVVKGLVWALGSRSRRLAKAACNAVMDLSASPIGRERLRDSFAVEKLLSLFCGVATFPEGSVSLLSMEKGSNDDSIAESKEDNFPALVLDAVVILINTSAEDFLDRIPEELFKRFFPLLKELWDKIRGSRLPSFCSWKQSFLQSTKYDLATFIFRLSMNRALFLSWAPDEVRISIFGSSKSEFESFVLNYWEDSPLLFRRALKNSENDTTIFSSLIHSFNPITTETILYSVLQGLVACPPIASDELDIFSFLNEVNGVLGSPVVYGQDIRILKTPKLASDSIQGDANKKQHFFNGNMGSEFIDVGSVQKCKEAFQDGYTLALRGMEFRSDKIAAIADGLAIIFGQPSVGANLYLTPPGSQGLARHYDDHCVFVWQLFGQKKWRISPRSATLLPRLYEHLGTSPGLEGDLGGGMQYLLKEGDILYIPRGCYHEAHTIIDQNESQDEVSTKFSLHLTLGIEVELPFEWEGFAHVALHCWNEKQKSCHLTDSRLRKQRAMLVNLLHVAIRLIADDNHTFRKACMVAALPLTSDTLPFNQKSTFGYIIERIDARSSFVEAFKSIKTVVQERNDDSLQWMRWLQHLPQEGDDKEKIDFNNLLGVFEDLVLLYSDHISEAVTVFSLVKSKFCRDAVFEDACKSFKMLLEKYRNTRRRYMNGMLSLHST